MRKSLRLEQLQRLINEECDFTTKMVLDGILEMCASNQLLLASHRDFNLKAYRVMLEPLIESRTVRVLPAEKILTMDDDFFQDYKDPIDSLVWESIAPLANVVVDSNIFSAVADCIEDTYGSRIELRMYNNGYGTLPSVAGHMVESAMQQVIAAVAGKKVFFSDPVAALQAIVQFPPIAISDTEIIVLTK